MLQRLAHRRQVFRSRAATSTDNSCPGIPSQPGVLSHQLLCPAIADLAIYKLWDTAIGFGHQHVIFCQVLTHSQNGADQIRRAYTAVGAKGRQARYALTININQF